jgi:hypothetical protein
MPGPLPSMRCWSVLEVSVVTVKVMVGAFWPECRGQVRGAIGLCERDTLYLLTEGYGESDGEEWSEDFGD